MRRMLDPKTIGGGETANKLYQHTINCWASSYDSVYLTIYNTSIEKIDSEAKIKTAIKSIGKVIATGYIQNGSVFNAYLVSYSSSDDKVVVNGYRIDTSSGSTKLLKTKVELGNNFSSIEDYVSAAS